MFMHEYVFSIKSLDSLCMEPRTYIMDSQKNSYFMWLVLPLSFFIIETVCSSHYPTIIYQASSTLEFPALLNSFGLNKWKKNNNLT